MIICGRVYTELQLESVLSNMPGFIGVQVRAWPRAKRGRNARQWRSWMEIGEAAPRETRADEYKVLSASQSVIRGDVPAAAAVGCMLCRTC